MTPSTDSEFNVHHPQPLLIVISGPSGAGKDTVMQRMKERGLPFHFVVTATTRPQRANETHGKDYFFVTKEEFAHMINEDELKIQALVNAERATRTNGAGSQLVDLALVQSIYHALVDETERARDILKAALAYDKDDPAIAAALDALGY